jgi:hypothetical protein
MPAPRTTLIELLLDALKAETGRAADAVTEPVTVSFDFFDGRHPESEIIARVKIERATRTIVFSTGEITDVDGRRLMAATAVHRILGA